jgi:hypothetical protein
MKRRDLRGDSTTVRWCLWQATRAYRALVVTASVFWLLAFTGAYCIPATVFPEYQLVLGRAEDIACSITILATLVGGVLVLASLSLTGKPSPTLVACLLVALLLSVTANLLLPAIAVP